MTAAHLPAAGAADPTRLIFAHSSTFTWATALLPGRQRRAIRTLYAFCRATDDLVDEGGATAADLEDWRRQTTLPAAEARSPVVRAWIATRDELGIDPRYEQELIDGVALDLARARYRTWGELERYCYLVASTVGLMALPVLGLARGAAHQEAARYAVRLGIALQLTNILRDVGEDAARGRVYLPENDLHRFGLTRADVLSGVHDERFVALMRFEILRARGLFEEALPGIALLAPGARMAVAAAALLYRAILDEIEGIDYRVHTMRAHTSRRGKLALLPGIALWIARLSFRGGAWTGLESAAPGRRVA